MKKKNRIYYYVFVFLQIISAPSFADTISIDNVEIHAIREQFFQQKQTTTYWIDSFSKSVYGNIQLSELLQYSTNVYINNYGLGASATISMRGTADDQTAIFWNGVNIRYSSLGTTDLSLIPIQSNNQINIVTNSASSVYGSGAFGGSILLSNTPNWNNIVSTNFQYSLGSFQQHFVSQQLQIGNSKVQFHTQNIFQKAENNFYFKDEYLISKPIRQITHNAMQNWATQNYLFIKLKRQQQIHFGSWVQQKQKEIPATMGGNLYSVAKQKDFTVKNYILYKKVFKKNSLYNRTSAIYDFQNYNNPEIKINALYKLFNLHNSLNYRHYLKHNITLDAGLDYFFDKINISEYKNKYFEHRASLFLGAKWTHKQISVNTTMRQEIYYKQYIRPMFAISFSYTSKNNLLDFNINYADKFRLPDFNDKYWPIGGNPNLLPEKGYALEINPNINIPIKTAKYRLSIFNSFYFSRIKDNIVWSPLVGVFWEPQNIKNTQHYGIESSIQQTWKPLPQLKLLCNVQYAYNHSSILKDVTNNTIGKILRYKPLHKIRANILLEDKYFFVGINYNYNSSRYTDDENNEAFKLKAYHLVDFIVGYKLYIKNINTQFMFQINNISNTSYETIRSYAQPLRNYRITFQINYSK